MLVRLTTGERFPMLCRKIGKGIQAIPQSVFAESGAERWRIMCEPHLVRDGYNVRAIMELKLLSVKGDLFMEDIRLKRSAKARLLFSHP